MLSINNRQVIGILSDTLSEVDPRLINHGKRVAYLMFKILEPKGLFDDKSLRDVCLLAMLHDIGAYKTEEIDEMVLFETTNIWEHSIYGYLFLKYLSPLRDLAPVMLFHHAKRSEISNLDPTLTMLSQLVSLADTMDIYHTFSRPMAQLYDSLEKWRDIYYSSEVIDMLLESKVDLDTVFDSMGSDEEFDRILYEVPLKEEESIEYISMIAYSIDFRSAQTVVHTVATASAACYLARLSGADKKELLQVRVGALLHDLGKISTPLSILESPNRLSEDEMDIMRHHVAVSDKILRGNISDAIRNIAVNHHEKLNGLGYPKKLSADNLAYYDRVLAVSDIFSALWGTRSYKKAYPKDRIIGILEKMAEDGALDKDIVSLVIENFDDMVETLNRESQPLVEIYKNLSSEGLYIYSQIEIYMDEVQKYWNQELPPLSLDFNF